MNQETNTEPLNEGQNESEGSEELQPEVQGITPREVCRIEHHWKIFDNFYKDIDRSTRIYAAYCGECSESRALEIELKEENIIK